MVILLFGPPGCGKGTQSPLITKLLDIPAISTGEMLRAEIKASSPLGKKAQSVLAEGRLLDDEIVSQMLVSRLSQPDCRNGFLLDGYPRTLPQAKFLDSVLKEKGFPAPTIFYFTAPAAVLVERIVSRRNCPTCGRIYNLLFKPPQKPGVCDFDGTKLVKRADDTVEIVQERLTQYEQQTKPVLDYFAHGDFHAVNANRPPIEIFKDIEEILGKIRRGQAPVA